MSSAFFGGSTFLSYFTFYVSTPSAYLARRSKTNGFTMVTHDAQNAMFTLAADFINHSSRSVFLTGKAGTGKTTFLKYIKQFTRKQTAVVAPTGVAAINAGGVTIHSFFQMPFTPFIPESMGFGGNSSAVTDKHHLLSNARINSERREIFEKLELLIIDEISMVRADVLDAIDTMLRHFRHRSNEPFGGVQTLYIGDMFQLPPVAGDNEWNILQRYYQTPYFFSSRVAQQQPPLHIELDKIYRQNEQQFIDVLNNVRNNTMDDASFAVLDSRFDPWFENSKDDSYITLTTHNRKADAINAEAMENLRGESRVYKAVVEGDFGDKSYPADANLLLKLNAQVMFIKNDVDKRFFNGKIGMVTRLENESVFVQCKDDPNEIEVKAEKWDNIRYSVANDEVKEDIVGSFKQLPLRLAWAITIHKSQGLTFEKAVIDAGSAFASGQVYVALSRCTSLKGMVLKSKLTPQGMHNDDRIVAFAAQKQSHDHLLGELEESKRQYQKQELLRLLDFSGILLQAGRAMKIANEHGGSFGQPILPWLTNLVNIIEDQLIIGNKFSRLLEVQYMNPLLNAEQQQALDIRISKSFHHFTENLSVVAEAIQHSPATTDSRQIAMSWNAEMKSLYNLLAFKLHVFFTCAEIFTLDSYTLARQNFVAPGLQSNAYSGSQQQQRKTVDSPHPELYQWLRNLRDDICKETNTPIYIVAGSTTLDEMARYLPQTMDELGKISGFGKVKLAQYGLRFLGVIVEYCEVHGLESNISEKKAKRERKDSAGEGKTASSGVKKEGISTTMEESYRLFKEGKKTAEISAIRMLTQQTIEGHLAWYVERGIISVNELVSREKIVLIEPALEGYEGKELTPIKQKLGDEVSYSEIRLVMAGKKAANKS